MSPAPDSSETGQTEGEGPDEPNKPPSIPTMQQQQQQIQQQQNANRRQSVPMPPSDANAHPKEPGFSQSTLIEHLIHKAAPPHLIKQDASSSSTISGSQTPSATSSPTMSDSESWSVPSTAPPSRAPSRHPSMTGEKPKISQASPGRSSSKGLGSRKSSMDREIPPMVFNDATIRSPPPRPPSVLSDGGEKHKFSLKDLLGTAPKLSRRSSQKSTGSSRKSDSDNGKSVAGESAVSLTSKYGVCGKIAIGKGATSVVRLAHKWDRTEEKLYAVKEFRKRRKNESEKEYVKKLTSEFCISSTLHHVNCVETVDLVQDESARWCEVMEFCPGGDLYAAIKKGGMSESEVECCFKQILCGVKYLHGQGVAHRDIKPENLFFDAKGHLKIGDYGASTVYRLPWETQVHMSTGLCGSEPYIAPEQFLGKPYDARLVDIWACGIVYYCLHFQELPWRAAQQSDALYAAYSVACAASPLPFRPDVKSKKGEADKAKEKASTTSSSSTQSYPSTIHNLPRQSRLLMRRVLEPDPKARWVIDDIVKDSWIVGIEVCHAVDKPSHIHASAKSMATQVGL